MISREIFEELLQEITFTLHRNFKDAEINFLFGKMEKFDEVIFKKVLSWYLREDHPPKNIVGYFFSRMEPMQGEIDKREMDTKTAIGSIVDLEYTEEQADLLRKCSTMALEFGRNKDLDFDGNNYTTKLYERWSNLPEINLTSYLENELKKLKQIEKEALNERINEKHD